MQKLHLVGFTTDLDGLIFATRKGAKSGSYVLALDDRLVASIDEARRMRDGTLPPEPAPSSGPAPVTPPVLPRALTTGAATEAPKRASRLSPREIQARLRAGGSIADIAAAAGVEEEWVLRFAPPIRAEQARVVDRALRLDFVKARLGRSAEPLGPSVKWNLSDKGVSLSDDVFDHGWSAYNLHGTTWAVRFSYASRARQHAAVWQVDLREGEVIARGRLASELGYVEPGRKPARLGPLEEPSGPPGRPARAPARARTVAARPAARP
ncbi:MAG: septation protein SepH, partial [Acidimicrobiales bacterium]